MIKQFVPSEYCLRCKGCCRFAQEDSNWVVRLCYEDIQELLKHKMPAASLTAKNTLRLEFLAESGTFICSLLDQKNNSCTMYAYRPLECQLYPFVINRLGKEVFLCLDKKCPYIEQNFQSAALRDYTQYITTLFLNKEMLESLRRNPQIIQTYEGLVTLSQIAL